jgi:predicted transcriptional regulator
MKKARLSVYLDPDMMNELVALAERKRQSKSLIAEAAITSFVTPDDADRREAAVTRRLDMLTRQGERMERDLWIAAEALALFIRFWLTITPPLPESAQAAAQAKGVSASIPTWKPSGYDSRKAGVCCVKYRLRESTAGVVTDPMVCRAPK